MEALDLLMPPAEAMDAPTRALTVEELKARITQTVSALVVWVLRCQTLSFLRLRRNWCPKC